MRPSDEGGASSIDADNHGHEQWEGEPGKPRTMKTKVPSHDDSRSPPRPSRIYESYRPGRPASPPRSRKHYESYRPERPISPPRLRDTFRREFNEDIQTFQDRHSFRSGPDSGRDEGFGRQGADRRDDYVRNLSSAAPDIDDRRPAHQFPPLQRPSSHAPLRQPRHSETHFRNKTWVKPASPLTVQTAESRSGLKGTEDLTRSSLPVAHPPIDQTIKQSPHIFIPAARLPVNESTIKHLEGLRAKSIPTKAGSRHVFMDDTGYFVTFPGGKHGMYQQALWLKTNERTFLFGKYRLDSMVSFSSGRSNNAPCASPSDTGRSNADTAASEEKGSTGLGMNTIHSSIRGAAAAPSGNRTSTALQGGGSGGFIFRGVASTPSPGFVAGSPTTETSYAVNNSQVRRTNLSISPQAAGIDLLHKVLIPSEKSQLYPSSITRQEIDDAASSISGAAESDISGSKAPKCHICKSRHVSLVKCSTCNRHYHRHCHIDPLIPQHLSSDWQCRRCTLKKVSLKRGASPNLSSILQHSAQKKQRLSHTDDTITERTIDITSAAVEPHRLVRSALSGITRQEVETCNNVTSATVANTMDVRQEITVNDDEADNLVTESFTATSVGSTSKRGGKLRAMRRKITVPQLDDLNGGDNEAMSAPDNEGADSAAVLSPGAPLDHLDRRQITQEDPQAQAPKLQDIGAVESGKMDVSAPSTAQDRPADGKKAKKTQEFRKRKCTSCNVRSVPFNPYGRTVCQTCKDAEVEMHKSLVESKANEAPHQSRSEHRSSNDRPEAILDVQATSADAANIGSVANEATAHPVLTPVGPAVSGHPVLAAIPTAAISVSASANPSAGDEAVAANAEFDVSMRLPCTRAKSDEMPKSDSSPSDSTDDDDDGVALSTLISKRAMNPNLKNRPPKNRRTRQHQATMAEDQYDLGNSFERPPNTYRRLAHLAISEAHDGRLKWRQIVQWIDQNVPTYNTREGNWVRGIVSTLNFASNTSGKYGVPTLKRYGPGGGEDWYEVLPEWKDKVDRWDVALSRPASRLAQNPEDSTATMDKSPPVGRPAEISPGDPASKTRSGGHSRSLAASMNKCGKSPVPGIPLDELMDVDSDALDDRASSPEEPLAQMRMNAQAVVKDASMEDLFAEETAKSIAKSSLIAESADVDGLFPRITPSPCEVNLVGNARQAIGSTKGQTLSIHDITLEQVLACRPKAVHSERYRAWPSLHPKNNEFDYEAKMAEIRLRPGRKSRCGQKTPADAEGGLAVMGPSSLPPWPPIDNSLGLTQERFGDELSLQPCKTWDEFFGTTEEVRPCIVEGKLAYRPVGEKLRIVYKTLI